MDIHELSTYDLHNIIKGYDHVIEAYEELKRRREIQTLQITNCIPDHVLSIYYSCDEILKQLAIKINGSQTKMTIKDKQNITFYIGKMSTIHKIYPVLKDFHFYGDDRQNPINLFVWFYI